MRRWTVLIVSMLVLAACAPMPPIASPIAPPTRDMLTPALTPVVETLPPPVWGKCSPVIEQNAAGYVNPATEITVLDPGPGDTEKDPSTPVYATARQLIVTGQADAIANVIALANQRLGSQSLRPVLQPAAETGVIGRLVNVQGIQTRLYEFQPGQIDLPEVVDMVRTIAFERGLPVLVDFNYMLAATPPRECRKDSSSSSGEADPLSGEDSPLSGEDSPLSGEDSLFGIAAGTVAADRFREQWALNDDSVGGIQVAAAGPRRAGRTVGEGAQLVILDTSPFTQTGLAVFSGPGWVTPTLKICVEHAAQVDLTLDRQCDNLPDQSDHGLFVASLAHAVAPGGDLHLVRVLNGHGRGDLGATLYALSSLDRSRLEESRTVINMSLGFVPVSAREPGRTLKSVCRSIERVDCSRRDAVFALVALYPSLDADQRQQLEDVLDAATLELYVADLLESNVVIVAAAGNESSGGEILEPQLPASYQDSYDEVLAVAASTHERERAFYSNRGTLAAPGGGDNRRGCADTAPCEPPGAGSCWCSLDYWMIGVGTDHMDEADPAVTWHYGAWVGTSFAAPLISGMAAAAFPTAGNAANLAARMRTPDPCSSAHDPEGALGRGIASFCP